MNKRINELQLIVDELEAKRTESQKTITESNQRSAELQETNADQEMEHEIVMLMNDLSTPPPNMALKYYQNKNETLHYSSSTILPSNESSSQTSSPR